MFDDISRKELSRMYITEKYDRKDYGRFSGKSLENLPGIL
jgi:hypothetical protein